MPRRELAAFGASIVAFRFALALWLTLLPLYLDARGLSPEEAGFAFSLVTAMAFLTALPAGVLIDVASWGLVAACGSLLFILLTILSEYIESFAAAVALTSLAGLCVAIYNQSTASVVSQQVSLSRRGRAFSAVFWATHASNVAGAAVAGLLAASLGYSAINHLSSAVFALSAALALLGASRGRRRRGVLSVRAIRSKKLWLLNAALVLHDSGVYMVVPFTALFLKYYVGISDPEYAFLVSARSAALFATQLPVGLLIDRMGAVPPLLAHVLGFSACAGLLLRSQHLLDAIIAFIAWGLVITLDTPARRYLLTRLAPSGLEASISGLSDTIVGLATLLSAYAGSRLWTWLGGWGPIAVGAAVNLLALVPLALLAKTTREL